MILNSATSADHKTGRYYCIDCFAPTLQVQLAADIATNQNPTWNTPLVPNMDKELQYDFGTLSEVLEEEGWSTVVRTLVPVDDELPDPVDEEEPF